MNCITAALTTITEETQPIHYCLFFCQFLIYLSSVCMLVSDQEKYFVCPSAGCILSYLLSIVWCAHTVPLLIYGLFNCVVPEIPKYIHTLTSPPPPPPPQKITGNSEGGSESKISEGRGAEV